MPPSGHPLGEDDGPLGHFSMDAGSGTRSLALLAQHALAHPQLVGSLLVTTGHAKVQG
jgi:hypothetical protein